MTTTKLNQIANEYVANRQNFIGNCVFLRYGRDRYLNKYYMIFWLNGREIRLQV